MSDALADALELDMAGWWAPTPAKYLGSVSKDQLAQAVTEAKSAEVAKPMTTMKKPDAITFAAAKLEGKQWLPAPLRRKDAEAAVVAATTIDDDDGDEKDK